MKLALTIVAALSVVACAGPAPPTTPTPAPAPAAPPVPEPPPQAPVPEVGFLWVMVFPGNNGNCLPDATVEVIIDGIIAHRAVQETPCDYWDDGGGALFQNLPVKQVTVRASAPGYVAREVTVTPSLGWYTATAIGLERAN